jgi:hypothetical protein
MTVVHRRGSACSESKRFSPATRSIIAHPPWSDRQHRASTRAVRVPDFRWTKKLIGQAADHIQAADSGEGDQRPGVHDDRFSHAA